MPNPSVLLFDLGGVLVESSHLEDLINVAPVSPDEDWHDLWLSSAVVQLFERGQIGTDEFAQRFVQEWRSPLSPAAFLERFVSWPKGFYPGVEPFLARLRPDYRVGYLSNSNELHWSGYTDILAHADIAFSSHLCGLVKPDPALFELVIKELDVTPNEISFFDDSRANVEAACNFGIDAHLVRGFAELEAKFGSLGLLQPL